MGWDCNSFVLFFKLCFPGKHLVLSISLVAPLFVAGRLERDAVALLLYPLPLYRENIITLPPSLKRLLSRELRSIKHVNRLGYESTWSAVCGNQEASCFIEACVQKTASIVATGPSAALDIDALACYTCLYHQTLGAYN